MLLDPTIATELKREHALRLEDGTLPPEPVLRRSYETFAAKFGPAALRRMDGIELLEGLVVADDAPVLPSGSHYVAMRKAWHGITGGSPA